MAGKSEPNQTIELLDGEEIIVKSGKFGLYCSYKNKNRSYK